MSRNQNPQRPITTRFFRERLGAGKSNRNENAIVLKERSPQSSGRLDQSISIKEISRPKTSCPANSFNDDTKMFQPENIYLKSVSKIKTGLTQAIGNPYEKNH